MFKSEQSMAIPGEYTAVFESCILALKEAKVRVKSANPTTGVISGRTYSMGIASMDRVDVSVESQMGQCMVTVKSEFSSVAVTDYGRNARNVERFFNALIPHVASLANNPQEAAAISSPTASRPSSNYSSAPMRRQLRETPVGQTYQWARLGCVMLFLLIIVIVAISVMVSTPH